LRNVQLYNNNDHQFILLNESEPGEEQGIRSNQYLIRHGGDGVLLDPGGFGVMPRVLAEMLRHIEAEAIRAIILSHQDPDIVGGLATWLSVVPARVYVSGLWLRFLPHYGLQDMERFIGVPDAGQPCRIGEDFELQLLPAHFLHSEGQINTYDPVSRILFTGDIGAALLPDDVDPVFVDDFEAHLPYIEAFHRRYMGSKRAARIWVAQARTLDIDMLAPQHGPIYRGAAVSAFLDWFEDLECGIDLMTGPGAFR